MEDADVGGARWEILLQSSRVARTSTRGSLGGAKFTRSGQTGKNRRYDAINPCLFLVNLIDGKAIRDEGEEAKDDFKERTLSFSYKLRPSIRAVVNNHHDLDRFSPRSS